MNLIHNTEQKKKGSHRSIHTAISTYKVQKFTKINNILFEIYTNSIAKLGNE